MWLLLIKNNKNFSNKENSFVLDRSSWMSFFRAQNCSVSWVLITEFNTKNFFFQKENYIQSQVKNLRWSVL